MRIGKLLTASAVALLVIMQSVPVEAKDTTITLDQDAKAFVNVEEDLDFQDMQPGEERVAKININNSSKEKMQFYVNGELLDNIADKAETNPTAVYEIDLQKEGEAAPYYKGLIGSTSNKNVANNIEEMKKDTLLAELGEGESTTLQIRVILDGESMGNEYMNKAGKMRINISASDIDQGQQVFNFLNVKTGDTTNMMIYIVICSIALAVVIAGGITFFKRKKIDK